MQTMEETLRKHVKNQIQLKLYYEHLQQVIQQLKSQQRNSQILIQNLKTQNQKLKEKQKPVPTSNNTKDDTNNGVLVHTSGFESKLDTITKIKNRLSLNDTGDFYARNIGHKLEKDPYVKQLHSKRESLASTLQKLYENQTLKKQSKSKSKKSLKRSNSKKSHSKSQTKLSKSKKNSPRKDKKEGNKTYNCLSSRKNSQV